MGILTDSYKDINIIYYPRSFINHLKNTPVKKPITSNKKRCIIIAATSVTLILIFLVLPTLFFQSKAEINERLKVFNFWPSYANIAALALAGYANARHRSQNLNLSFAISLIIIIVGVSITHEFVAKLIACPKDNFLMAAVFSAYFVTREMTQLYYDPA